MVRRDVVVDAVKDRRNGIDVRVGAQVTPRLDVQLDGHDGQVVVLQKKSGEGER